MKYFLLAYTLILIPFALFASNTDISTSQGTTQDVIVHLSPTVAQEDVLRDIKIEVTFSVLLDISAIKEHDVKLTHLSSKTNDSIEGSISYTQIDKKLTFTPHVSLEPGLYEIQIKSLKAQKGTKIKEIKYRFVVINEVLQRMTIHPDSLEIKERESLQLEVMGYYNTGAEKNVTTQVQWSIADNQIAIVDNSTLKSLKEGSTTVTGKVENIEASISIVVFREINGHKLPPEPDSAINNSTLLGIDSNSNGVRDDVERYIIIHYGKDLKYPKTKTAIALQYAWASQKILESPTYGSKKYIDDALDCQRYWAWKKMKENAQGLSGFEQGKYYSKLTFLTDPILKDKIYNTKIRIHQKFSFNAALSGNIFQGRDESIENCRINIDLLGE